MKETTPFLKGPPTSPTLLAALEKAKSHVMTAEERRAQRVSFIYGLQGRESTRTKEEIAAWLDERDGISELKQEITRLSSRIKELEEGLRPFAEIAAHIASAERDDDDVWWDGLEQDGFVLNVGDLRKARSVLSEGEKR